MAIAPPAVGRRAQQRRSRDAKAIAFAPTGLAGETCWLSCVAMQDST
jgi:hypothetical protein